VTKKREPIFVKQGAEPPAPKRNHAIEAKKKELELIKKQERIYHCLPHLYGYKWYRWARAFFNCTHKVQLLTAGNQLSKSSTMIRKCIDWATDKRKWPELWPGRDVPRLFWYFYPTLTVATTEVETKWIPEFLPREDYADDPIYGWKLTYDKQGNVQELAFNSGVVVQFKAYSMQAVNLQTSTVFAMFVDEELPMHLYDELMFRLHATDGYFCSVFTATLGQEFWRCAMEEIGTEHETLKDAYKVQVSAYDCITYEDGSPSPWTLQRIKAAEAKCKNQAEIDKRIKGRFVMDTGVKYAAFDSSRHIIKPRPIPPDWGIYAGVDNGSGGETGHPAAICFIAVAPNMRLGYVFRGWRGDDIKTTAGDVFDKFNELAGALPIVRKGADPRAVDLHTIAVRAGAPFEKSESKHEIGEGIIATLFKNDMLFIFDDPELRKLAVELSSVTQEKSKKYAKDDLCDALRYCAVLISWDWEIIADKFTEAQKMQAAQILEETPFQRELRERRGEALAHKADEWDEVYQELEEANYYYDN
jgi:hypothetical protein